MYSTGIPDRSMPHLMYGTKKPTEERIYNPYKEDGVKAPSLDTITEGIAGEEPDGFTGATRNEHTVEIKEEKIPTTPEEVLVQQSSGVVVPQVDTSKPKKKPEESVVIQQPKSNKVAVAYQWDEIQDPKSFVARQKERRAYYTSLLETGNVGSAFKAMYAIEEDNLGKWNRNSKRDYFLDQGYTAESIQEYINTGEENSLSKGEAMKEVTFNDGVWVTDSQYNKQFKLRDVTKEDKVTTWDDGEGNLYERNSKGSWMKVVTSTGQTAIDGKLQTGTPDGAEKMPSKDEKEFMDMIDRLNAITDDDYAAVSGNRHLLFPQTAITSGTKTAMNKFIPILSKTFLQNVSQMKGMGALSNAEGSKLTGSATMLVDPETGTLRLGLDEDVVRAEVKKLMASTQNLLKIQQFHRKNGREPTMQELQAMGGVVSVTEQADSYLERARGNRG